MADEIVEVLLVAGVVGVIGYLLYEDGFGMVDTSGWPQAPNDLVGNLAVAIAKQEGSNSKYNNPGDILDTYSYATNGTFGAGIPIFTSLADGVNALYTKLANIQNGGSSTYPLSLTFNQFGALYSGGDSNWAINVAASLGVSPDSTLGDYFSGASSASNSDATSDDESAQNDLEDDEDDEEDEV